MAEMASRSDRCSGSLAPSFVKVTLMDAEACFISERNSWDAASVVMLSISPSPWRSSCAKGEVPPNPIASIHSGEARGVPSA